MKMKTSNCIAAMCRPAFAENVLAQAAQIVGSNPLDAVDGSRKDLTHMPLMTIDGQGHHGF